MLEPLIRTTSTTLIIAAAMLAGCDSQQASRLEREANLQAIHVRQTAVSLSSRVLARSPDECGVVLVPERLGWGPHQTLITTRIESDEGLTTTLTTHIHIDKANTVRASEVVDYLEPSFGVRRQRSRQLMKHGNVWYASEDGLAMQSLDDSTRGADRLRELVGGYAAIVSMTPSALRAISGGESWTRSLRVGTVACARSTPSPWSERLRAELALQSLVATRTDDDHGRTTARHLLAEFHHRDRRAWTYRVTIDEATRFGVHSTPDGFEIVDEVPERDFWVARRLMNRALERRLLPVDLSRRLH